MSATELTAAADQIAFAREYTLRFLQDVGPDEWFRQPPGGVTHLAWQLGHLAMAEYRMTMELVRGRVPADDAFISEDFVKTFSRNSVPDPDPARYPPVTEIRAVFDRVHARALEELADLDPAALAEPPVKPHSIAKTKLRCLFWAGQHELVHAGQIALLRRLLGRPPLW
jgi:uncharacterized damage-inducible protein DinB